MLRIVDTLARRIARCGQSRRISKPAPRDRLIAVETLGRPVWTPRDYQAFAREGFMGNAIVYRSVRMISEAAASMPLLLYEGEEEIAEHPLLDLIRRPSPDHTGADFFEAWYGFLLVAGNAYVEAVAAGGRLRELHVLRPDRMQGRARRRRLARGLRVHGGREHGALRGGARARRAADPARAPLPSGERPLRHEPDRGGGVGDRSPQHGGALEQGAARQLGPAVGRARLCGGARVG